MPLTIANVNLGVIVSAASRHEEGQGAPASVGVKFPVGAGYFWIAGDEDVKMVFALELGAAFDGERHRVVVSPSVDQQSTAERFAEFLVQ